MQRTDQYKQFGRPEPGCSVWASLAFLFFLALGCAILKALGGG